MEFLLFLSSIDKEILDLVYKANFLVEENSPLCLLGKTYFGFLKKESKTMVICSQNAMDVGGYSIPRIGRNEYNGQTRLYIRRALRHESVHVAQFCNNGQALNMVEKDKMKLHPFKEKALAGSTTVSGNREKEHEAYWMEDRPNLVKSALKRFCF